MSRPFGVKKTYCPHCRKQFWLQPTSAEMPTPAQMAAAEILGSTSTPGDLLAILVAAWDAECDRSIAEAQRLMPDLDVEPMRAELRGRFAQWRRASIASGQTAAGDAVRATGDAGSSAPTSSTAAEI